MKTKKTYWKYSELSVTWQIVCYKYAKKLGYKGKEIKCLEFELKDGKIVSCIDKYLLADVFYAPVN